MPYQTTIYKINKIPLYSTRNYIQYSVTNHNGKEYENIYVCVCVCMHSTLLQSCLTLCNALDWSSQDSLTHGILQAEYWCGLPYPPPEYLPHPGVKTVSLCLLYWQVGSLPLVPAGSVQFSRSVVSDSLWPHESQHTRPRCPSPTPGIYSNPCPSSQWCHRTISSSVIPFSSCPQPLPASGLVQWVNSMHEVAKVLEFQLQHQSFQWTPRTDLL